MAFKKAVDRARKGKGPSIIVSDVVRLLPHSSSDDQRKYRSDKDLDTESAHVREKSVLPNNETKSDEELSTDDFEW